LVLAQKLGRALRLALVLQPALATVAAQVIARPCFVVLLQVCFRLVVVFFAAQYLAVAVILLWLLLLPLNLSICPPYF
jgi:hypothetical protein